MCVGVSSDGGEYGSELNIHYLAIEQLIAFRFLHIHIIFSTMLKYNIVL